MKKIFLLAIIFCSFNNLFSQITVAGNNNVGIGTNLPNPHFSPSKALIVNGSNDGIRSIIELWGQNGGKSIIQSVGGSTYLGNLSSGTNGTGNVYMTYNNGSVGIMLNSTGNVGIGTENPANKLDVYGNVLISPLNTSMPWRFNNKNSDPCLYSESNWGFIGRSDKPLCGVFSYYINCNGVNITSDERLKSNIKDIQGCLKKLRSVKGVSYDFNPEFKNIAENITNTAQKIYTYDTSLVNMKDSVSQQNTEKLISQRYEALKKDSKNKIGYLAQDLKLIFPELVRQDSITGLFSVDYIGMIPVLSNALNEQQTIIEQQNSNIAEMKAEIDDLRRLIKKGNKP
jgi:hypothetical protein